MFWNGQAELTEARWQYFTSGKVNFALNVDIHIKAIFKEVCFGKSIKNTKSA